MAGITTFLDTAQMPGRAQDQQTFDNLMAAVMQNFPKWGSEVNATFGAFNAGMAGGAYAIPYIFDSATADADPTAGKLRLDNATQNAATTLRLDTTSSGIGDVTSILDRFDASTSTIKGSIRLVKQGDLTKWLTFDVTARAAPTGYRNITVTNTGGSAASPFVNGDAVLLYFQRTGDKGDAGNQVTPILWVRDEKTSGTAGGTPASGYNVRALNTVSRNTISGASLSANRVTLPAGTYRYRGGVPAGGVGGHQGLIYNITDSAALVVGTSENSATSLATRSMFVGDMTITKTTVFELRHWCATTSGALGYATGSGANEVYSELIFEKVA